MDLQLPPPPRNPNPSFTSRNLPQQPPNSKSQDDWLRDCGHPSLHSFLEYYGFDPRDADDIAEGRDFLSLIRRQEQEQWEERQSQPQAQAQPARKGTVNNSPALARRSTANDSFSRSGTPATSMRSEVLSRSATPTMNIYGLRPFEMEEAERMGRMNAARKQSPAALAQQVPRSSEARFHNRVVSETVMNAYGIKPWEIEAAEGLRANLGSYGR